MLSSIDHKKTLISYLRECGHFPEGVASLMREYIGRPTSNIISSHGDEMRQLTKRFTADEVVHMNTCKWVMRRNIDIKRLHNVALKHIVFQGNISLHNVENITLHDCTFKAIGALILGNTTNVHLDKCVFTDINWISADNIVVDGLTLTDCRFNRCKFSNNITFTNLSAKDTVFADVKFNSCVKKGSFTHSLINGAIGEACTTKTLFQDVTFESGRFNKAKIKCIAFKGCSFPKTAIMKTFFHGCDFLNCDFSENHLTDITFCSSWFVDTMFVDITGSNTKVNSSDLCETSIHNMYIRRSCLIDCTMKKCSTIDCVLVDMDNKTSGKMDGDFIRFAEGPPYAFIKCRAESFKHRCVSEFRIDANEIVLANKSGVFINADKLWRVAQAMPKMKYAFKRAADKAFGKSAHAGMIPRYDERSIVMRSVVRFNKMCFNRVETSYQGTKCLLVDQNEMQQDWSQHLSEQEKFGKYYIIPMSLVTEIARRFLEFVKAEPIAKPRYMYIEDL
jgi:uncharacterized protein YjbI with pentapeptide repeats